MKSLFRYLQKVGKSLMLPVSVLPAAGILVAIGRVISENPGLLGGVGQVMFSGGISIFENLPLIFAIGVAIGFAGEAVAGLAAGVGYSVLAKVIGVMGTDIIDIASKTGGNIEEINTGVFGGIIIGFVAAELYKRYHQTKLPPYLGFFAGKRLVPILTSFAAFIVGILLAFIWPPIQIQINNFARWAIQSPLGPALYAAGKRALIPVGLHHVYYPPFLYEFGRFVTESGEVLRGEAARYFAGDPTAGKFMAAEYPIMLFGLPAACLAMFLRAKPDKRKAVAGIMSTAAITSFLTGITEPIEFSFIFVAPALYVFHVIGAFLAGLLTNFFGIRLGYTFSASFIDYILGISNAGNPWKFWLIVGPIIGVLYFVVFYFGIKWFNFETPGRGSSGQADDALEGVMSNPGEEKEDSKAASVLEALGGAENIEDIDACITRLRTNLVDGDKVDQDRLKQLGASGVMDAGGGNVQVVFGPESDALKDEIKKLLD
ncbi:PTS system D-glucosamine-specific IIA component, Glc family (TC 4.A.1.1.6)/PTS system D-glucosamine-specific IIB component, Glc family (TC 4.A.1.1.6)/PTS system D-glucosamine-specific IIC component, Glc family (TC 4.A.1.1.6) [Selenihalanaerobacter shriftii]|uniref:PTS system D-glucosamine-specific IIA component, Glc family (TC 4.A.1.1.6)/PTS system D-glucosamine-specific IIB component, Glc family (TC 4.A.1.1.6)/PTS system D-glucosamine-specific IIC component... n=2 Tax=Selenihalanaerobacter shriftii TaxID=142842 RepID=A0A1T4PT62_9FIRM|nr:PTS system D-glucosamine-specific IIA component, Glc family (TC 4.A.1.1.6)/PTS system D-glucosamine-specific IIB component, Glc family (TC 4.A.1.1.6)/PTS system D-glucosamine-specific IIC component, Glc family (TC 4.A.1.1.6) [Selenihalanaerobacter shriftii]